MSNTNYNAMQGSGSNVPPPKRYDGRDGGPVYDASHGGHYGASSYIASQGSAPPPETFTGQWSNVSQGLSGNYRDILNTYWQNQVTKLETDEHDYKIHQLPLARIKKVMKADPEVKMISAEAPILFAKGCDIFITELTMRAWIHAEENKRRTLQRSDIASALAKSDMFDFLIDIVPREDATPQHKRRQDFPPGSFPVSDAQLATAGPSMQAPPAAAQLQSQEQGQQHMQATDYGAMGQHVAQEPYQAQQGMYPPPAPSASYAQPHSFDPNLYTGGYNIMQQTQMYPPQGPRMADPSMTANDGQHHYRAPEDDAEGERDQYEV
ncbi:histone-fold-containing protein [Aureobasidium sp. EXF-10728]|nr:histone-fold-containing protein [Aureobasidium sp. EXF-10728]